ncbi:AMP-binding protein [Dactylosporangium sp. NPDC051485]|uniref:class I adenylate-forming enzyme family protein n=1 Tax=Dactylosporangium sp. NPDC051485 TaxID=3154846 RepID=UPI00342A5DFC
MLAEALAGPACLVMAAAGRAWSMPELADRAAGIARALRPRLGDGPRRLWLATTAADELLATVLAVAGTHSCVLVDPDLTPYEYDTLAAAAPPAAVLAGPARSPVQTWAQRRAGSAPGGVVPAPGLGLFTSGTTGRPTLVELTVEQVVAAARGVAGRLRLGPGDTGLALNELNHTLGFVTTLLAPLLAGGRTVVRGLHEPGPLGVVTATYRPTWCASSPTLFRRLLRLADTGGLAMPGIRLLRASSAPLTPVLQQRLGERFGAPVLNAYAMTEAPGEIASQPLPPAASRPGTVGWPTLCEVSVRDAAGRELTGATGEIWVRGPTVAHDARGPDGWLRTGDLGIRDAGGELNLIGRSDDVINYGGKKFAPQEVEAVAELHPAVVEAVAFPVHDDSLGEKVGLAVVLGADVSRRELRAHLLGHLSPGKIPQMIRSVPAIPANRRGKVLRRRMAQLLAALPDTRELP